MKRRATKRTHVNRKGAVKVAGTCMRTIGGVTYRKAHRRRKPKTQSS